MTNKGFWRQLENIVKTHKDPPGMATLKFAPLLRQAYQEDLWLPCGVQHTAPDLLNQLYISLNPNSTQAEGCRWMLCYTSPAAAAGDTLLPEQWEELPVRFVIDNAMSKPSIGGLLFNRHRTDFPVIIPKNFVDPGKTYFQALKELAQTPPTGFPQ